MVRALLVGLLSLGAGVACGSGDDAPAVAAGTAAGKVIDVTGSVQATRNGVARPLAQGAEVFGDDVVATAAGGSVVIELFHNQARWSVESGRSGRVDASLAWGLAKQAATAPVEHATAAAGRNAERSAADTGATAAPTTATAPIAPPAAEAAPASAEGAKQEAMPAPAKPGAAPRRATATLPPPPPPAASAADALQDRETKSLGIGTLGSGRGGGAAPAADAPARSRAAASTSATSLADVLAKHRRTFAACLDAATPKATLAVIVRDRTARFVVTGASAEVRACIERVGQKLALTTDGRATLELVR